MYDVFNVGEITVMKIQEFFAFLKVYINATYVLSLHSKLVDGCIKMAL